MPIESAGIDFLFASPAVDLKEAVMAKL